MNTQSLPIAFCPKCGHQNHSTFKHCSECGTAIPAVTPTPHPVYIVVTLTWKERIIRSLWLLGLLIGTTILSILRYGISTDPIAFLARTLGVLIVPIAIGAIACLFVKKESSWVVFISVAYVALILMALGMFSELRNP